MDIEVKISNIAPEQISPTIRDLKSVFANSANRQEQILEQLQLYLQQHPQTPLKSAAIDTPPSSFADELLPPRSLPAIPDDRSTPPASTVISDSPAPPDSTQIEPSEKQMSQIDRWLRSVATSFTPDKALSLG
jgi:hypothetical protein